MELQNLKEQINKAGFSQDALASLNSILDKAIATGSFSEEDRGKMSKILDGEIEQSKTQAAVMQEIVFGLESYANELDQIVKVADEKVKSAEEDFNGELNDLEEQVNQVSTPNNPSTA